MAKAERPEVGPLPTLAQVEAELYSRSLREFVDGAWPILEPTTQLRPNWHIDAICEHLEAVTRQEILRLVINVPFRSMKSLGVAVFWPAWVWTFQPSFRWLFSSYAQQLSTRDSVKCRRIIQSQWYQDRWGKGFSLTSDQNVKTRFENDRTGYRIATSVDGAATGEGGDAVVVDDPVNYREAESDQQRTAANDWWDLAMGGRLNDPDTSARVIIMQRLHQHDLTGHVMAKERGYEHLMIPMRYESERKCVTVLGWSDPRKTEGELMWPGHFTEKAVRSLESSLGPYGTAGQLQQRPTARKGGQYERAWFSIISTVPRAVNTLRVRFWDKAGTEGGGAYTAGVLMGLRPGDGKVWVEDVVRGQWGAGNRENVILQTAQLDAQRYGTNEGGVLVPNKMAVLNVLEQEPGSGGKADAENTVRNLAGYRVEAEVAAGKGSKEVRADPLAGAAKNGDVHIIEGPWNEEFLAEMEAAGPGAAYVDQRDAAAGAYNRLMKMLPSITTAGVDVSVVLEDDDVIQPASWRIE